MTHNDSTDLLSSSLISTAVLVSPGRLGQGLTAKYDAVRLPWRSPSYTKLFTMGRVMLYRPPGLGMRWVELDSRRVESAWGPEEMEIEICN